MIQYSDRATQALVRLYRRFNDIVIFVEDITYSNLYLLYFNRILPRHVKLTRVFGLGTRQKVVDACAQGIFRQYQRRLFIIDGDLDLLLGRPAPVFQDLYRLPVYCIENLLISEIAAIEIATESSSDETREQIRGKIDFRNWRRRVVELAAPLFLKYAAAHNFGVPVALASYGGTALCDGKKSQRRLSEKKVRDRIGFIHAEILRMATPTEIRATEKVIRANLGRGVERRQRFISGKTYLLPLLYIHLKTHTKFNDTFEAFKVRLARHSDVKSEPGLFARVLALAGSDVATP